jgi:hypothetical protein
VYPEPKEPLPPPAPKKLTKKEREAAAKEDAKITQKLKIVSAADSRVVSPSEEKMSAPPTLSNGAYPSDMSAANGVLAAALPPPPVDPYQEAMEQWRQECEERLLTIEEEMQAIDWQSVDVQTSAVLDGYYEPRTAESDFDVAPQQPLRDREVVELLVSE